MDLLAWLLPGLNVVLAAIYVQVGMVVLARRPSGDGRLAGSAFAGWWFMLGLVTGSAVLDHAVRATVGWTVATYLTYLKMTLLVVVVALAFLMYYLVYLFSGRRRAWAVLGPLYAAYYAAVLYYLAYARPVGVVETAYRTSLRFARDMDGHWSTAVLGLLLVVPPLLAALGYLSLFFRVRDRSQRFRIAAVAGAFVFWFGTSLAVGQLSALGGTLAWRVGSAAVALAASWLVYVAFQPPRWIKRHFGVVGFGES